MRQSEEKVWATASHLVSIVFPLTGLIVYLIFKDKSRYVSHHAYQAMWFFFTAWIAGLVFRVIPLLGWVLVPALGVVVVCLAVVGGVNALAGHWWEYPVVGRVWRRALGS